MNPDPENITLSRKELGNFLRKICSRGVSFKFTAKGMSMAPFIRDGDMLIIEPYKKKIEIGDIVAYISPEEEDLFIHRIIGEKNGKYLLKGDNVYRRDGYCKPVSIHGYVKEIIRMGHAGAAQRFFYWLGRFKIIIAILSRYKILTPVCRVSNKFL